MLQTNLTKQPNLLVPVGDLSGDDGKFVAGMLGKGGVEFGLGSSVFNMRSNSVSLNGTGISFMFPLALADALDLVTQFDVNYLNGSQAGSAVNISSSTLERNVIDGTTNLGGFNFVFAKISQLGGVHAQVYSDRGYEFIPQLQSFTRPCCDKEFRICRANILPWIFILKRQPDFGRTVRHTGYTL